MHPALNVLAVIAHPRPDSFNHALLEETRAACLAEAATLQVRDLYADRFDPVMTDTDLAAAFGGPAAADVAVEQEMIAACDLLIIHYPVFWFDRPAILKGWFDRVFTAGFAFALGPEGTTGLLTAKQALAIQTAGVARDGYDAFGDKKTAMAPYPYGAIKTGTLEFCGCPTSVLTHYGLLAATDSELDRIKAQTRSCVVDAIRRTRATRPTT